MHIRPTTPADAPALATLMAHLGYPATADAIATRLAHLATRADIAIFVAAADTGIAGMIGLQISPVLYRDDPNGAITALVVSPDFRGRGVAANLIAHGEHWLLAMGAVRVSVMPSTHRADAHRLYERLGYAPTGTRFTKSLG
jgi:ribosomal protein S18 acetylase RimI-like enzyme